MLRSLEWLGCPLTYASHAVDEHTPVVVKLGLYESDRSNQVLQQVFFFLVVQFELHSLERLLLRLSAVRLRARRNCRYERTSATATLPLITLKILRIFFDRSSEALTTVRWSPSQRFGSTSLISGSITKSESAMSGRRGRIGQKDVALPVCITRAMGWREEQEDEQEKHVFRTCGVYSRCRSRVDLSAAHHMSDA